MYSFLAPILIALTLGYLATLIARLTGTVYIPYLILLGILVGPVLYLIRPGEAEVLFYNYIGPIGAAFVILAESAKIPRYLLRRIVKPLSMMLTFVLFVTGITTGVVLVFMLRAPVWVGFMVGAIISSTDPASVITSLRKTKVSEVPSTLLVTESVFNDPFSFLFLVTVILIFFPKNISYVQSSPFVFNNVFLYVIITQGSFPLLIAGALFGLLYFLRVKLPKDFKEYYTAMFLLFGLSAYSITLVVGGSGYMAAAIFGVLAGNFMPRDPEFESYKLFMDNISTFAAILIFVFLGASINLSILIRFVIPGVLIALILIFVIRPLAVVLAGSIDLSIKYEDLLFVGLEGTRGVFPAILAPTVLIMGDAANNILLQYWGQAIEAIVLVIVFTSLTIQPLLMGRIYRALHKEDTRFS